MIGVVKKNGGSLEELGRKVNLNAQNIDADSRAALRDKLGVENLPNDLATTEDIERATENRVNLDASNIDADSRAALRDKLGVENLPNDLATTEDIERATENKVDKTTETISSPNNSYKYIYIFNAGDEAKKMLAGDLGKNVANSNLTSIAGAGFSQGANWAHDTQGYSYYLKGLSDKSNDATFRRMRVQDENGQEAFSNGKEIFKLLPNVLNSAEKESFGIAWNDQYSNGNIQVYSISPPVFKYDDEIKSILLDGINLNLNPNTTQIKLIPKSNANGDGETDIIGFSCDPYGKWLIIDFMGNSQPIGEYNVIIRTTNPTIQVYRSEEIVSCVNNLQFFDFTSVSWEKKLFNNAVNDSVFGSGSAAQYQSSPLVKPYADENIIVSALKSSKVIDAGDDFYLKMTAFFAWHSRSGLSNHYVGLMPSNQSLGLVNQNEIFILAKGRGDSYVRNIYIDNSNLGVTNKPGGSSESVEITFIRKNNMCYYSVSRKGSKVQWQKTILPKDLSIAIFNENMKKDVNVKLNVQELYKF